MSGTTSDSGRTPFKGFSQKDLANEISRAIERNDCPSDELLGAYKRKEMKERERVEMKSHLSFCGRCQRRLNASVNPANSARPGAESETPSGRFRLLQAIGGGSGGVRRRRWITGAAAVLVAGLSLFVLLGTGGGSLIGHVAFAAGEETVAARREFMLDVYLPKPGFLVQIGIDGHGKLAVCPAVGDNGVQIRRRDRVRMTPETAGALDLFLAFVPGRGEFPGQLLAELKQFITSDRTLSRENQRATIATALKLHQLRAIEVRLQVRP